MEFLYDLFVFCLTLALTGEVLAMAMVQKLKPLFAKLNSKWMVLISFIIYGGMGFAFTYSFVVEPTAIMAAWAGLFSWIGADLVYKQLEEKGLLKSLSHYKPKEVLETPEEPEEAPEEPENTFIPRYTAPSADDLNFIKTSKGGYNYCIEIKDGSVMPNCVGYAWGRWRELLGDYHQLSRGNAENWYNKQDGYDRGQEPKLGAVICWKKGQAGDGSDGYGHVAIVEAIKADGTIVTSNSAYGGSNFYIKELKPPYSMGGTYKLQGFIYLPEK